MAGALRTITTAALTSSFLAVLPMVRDTCEGTMKQPFSRWAARLVSHIQGLMDDAYATGTRDAQSVRHSSHWGTMCMLRCPPEPCMATPGAARQRVILMAAIIIGH